MSNISKPTTIISGINVIFPPYFPYPSISNIHQKQYIHDTSNNITTHNNATNNKVTNLIVDSHCHVFFNIEKLKQKKTLAFYLTLMGTKEEDWEDTKLAHLLFPYHTTPCFGLHPWFVHSRSENWLEVLKKQLNEIESSIVGEIGLDKAVIKSTFQEQIDIFKVQLNLASELNKPVSIHCVRAYGDLFDILRSEPNLPPRIAIHSYTGSLEITKSILKLKNSNRVYFGFSSTTNMRSPEKMRPVIQSIPKDRIMIETDSDDIDNVEQMIQVILNEISEVRGWSKEETIQIITKNGNDFLGRNSL